MSSFDAFSLPSFSASRLLRCLLRWTQSRLQWVDHKKSENRTKSQEPILRVWIYDSSTLASTNATICCGAEIMLLEWDCKSDRLVLIGTADGGIKAWNVDAKRVVCDLNTTDAFPSPVEPLFVSAVSSRRNGTCYIDKLGFASLTVWNMRTWEMN
ncbi:hypothetical protein L1887_23507 [Cichorium endivia]|nr:hypothetical protein L1887_23507 [Cichorium endivia]